MSTKRRRKAGAARRQWERSAAEQRRQTAASERRARARARAVPRPYRPPMPDPPDLSGTVLDSVAAIGARTGRVHEVIFLCPDTDNPPWPGYVLVPCPAAYDVPCPEQLAVTCDNQLVSTPPVGAHVAVWVRDVGDGRWLADDVVEAPPEAGQVARHHPVRSHTDRAHNLEVPHG